MKAKLLLTLLAIMAACPGVKAVEMPVRVGVRAGINTSNISENRAVPGIIVDHSKEWKTGFALGAIVDIPMGSHFYLSPGFYYSYRHDDYNILSANTTIIDDASDETMVVTTGSVSTSWFQIPMLVSYRIPLKILELQLDFGPYVSMGLGGHDKYQASSYLEDEYTETAIIKRDAFGADGRYLNIDWGFDMGVGLLLAKHYYIGAHYLAGARNLAQDRTALTSARTRQWQFSVGYNF